MFSQLLLKEAGAARVTDILNSDVADGDPATDVNSTALYAMT